MTNAEKFKEVFGFYPDAHPSEHICNYIYCDDQKCETCLYNKDPSGNGIKRAVEWGDEYIDRTLSCNTCINNHSHHGVCDICKDFNCWTMKRK